MNILVNYYMCKIVVQTVLQRCKPSKVYCALVTFFLNYRSNITELQGECDFNIIVLIKRESFCLLQRRCRHFAEI